MFTRIDPARIEPDSTGAPFNPDYGDVYASRDGALAQARHVFLAGSDQPRRWAGRDQFVILETGFGLGVNFLAAWQAWRDDPRRPRRLHFVSVEKHPADAAALTRWAPPEVASLARELAAAWPLPLAGTHRCVFEAGAVTLTLVFGDVEHALPRIVAGVDAFFLDGFAPDRNPAMWSLAVMKAFTRLARADATVATWSTARAVRDALVASGFDVERSEGFGHKREMLRARFAPRWAMRRHEPPQPYRGAREAVVIGAGLAGAFTAYALAQRGWRVTVLERGARPGSGASGLPWGVLRPMVTADDSGATQLVRTGFFHTLAALHRLQAARGDDLWRRHGALLQADDEGEVRRWQALASEMQLPGAYARAVDAAMATDLLGVAPRAGGWWFGQGGSVAIDALCAALLDTPNVTLRTQVEAAALARTQVEATALPRAHDGWCVVDPRGAVLAEAPVCVVANALGAPTLLGLRHAPVRPIRGQVSWFKSEALGGLRAAVTGGGTLLRADEGVVGVGASYEVDPDTTPVDATVVHQGNVQRLRRLVAAEVDAVPVGFFDGVRCAARDRLPFAGAVADEVGALATRNVARGPHLADLPRQNGLFAAFAFGSRGLVLAALAADLIAAQIEGEPWPLARDLAAQVDPARFLLQRVRRRK